MVIILSPGDFSALVVFIKIIVLWRIIRLVNLNQGMDGITIYFIHTCGKLKLSFDLVLKSLKILWFWNERFAGAGTLCLLQVLSVFSELCVRVYVTSAFNSVSVYVTSALCFLPRMPFWPQWTLCMMGLASCWHLVTLPGFHSCTACSLASCWRANLTCPGTAWPPSLFWTVSTQLVLPNSQYSFCVWVIRL